MANSVTFKEVPVHIGDTIKVHCSFTDKDKVKKQIFEGIILKIRGTEDNKMITVRKMTRSNIGVERIFPLISPFVEKVEISKQGHSRRANIKYIRTRSKREIKDKIYKGMQ